jgi:hypothetical protein
LNVRRGRLEPTYGDWHDHRTHYGATYTWSDENDSSRIPVLSLKNIVVELLAMKETLNSTDGGIGVANLKQLEAADRDGLI